MPFLRNIQGRQHERKTKLKLLLTAEEWGGVKKGVANVRKIRLKKNCRMDGKPKQRQRQHEEKCDGLGMGPTRPDDARHPTNNPTPSLAQNNSPSVPVPDHPGRPVLRRRARQPNGGGSRAAALELHLLPPRQLHAVLDPHLAHETVVGAHGVCGVFGGRTVRSVRFRRTHTRTAITNKKFRPSVNQSGSRGVLFVGLLVLSLSNSLGRASLPSATDGHASRCKAWGAGGGREKPGAGRRGGGAEGRGGGGAEGRRGGATYAWYPPLVSSIATTVGHLIFLSRAKRGLCFLHVC